jgi:murein DD-endopeptidase MepM/ murein hydrolase activator NlpD
VLLRRVAVLLACAMAFGAAPNASADDPVATARKRLATVTKRLQDAEAREGVLADRLARLDRDLRRTERDLAEVRARFAVRARAAYTSGLGGDTIVVLMSTPDPDAVIERLGLFAAASRADDRLMRQGAALRHRLAGQRAAAADAHREAAATERAMANDTAEVRALFDRLQRAEANRAARSRTPRASRSVRLVGRYTCLVGPNHAFSDTWGAPRSGGRRHLGTDVFAPYGSPAYAVTDGVVTRTSSSSNGGLGLYLRGTDGNEYYYAHMSRFTSSPGQHVTAGTEVARVGDTGNARGGPAHVHFEVHAGGGYPVNPYPYVRAWC